MKNAVIVDALRTPMGRSKGGMFRNRRAEDLGADVVNGLLDRNPQLNPSEIDDILFGCVQQTLEQGFNVARFISLASRVPRTVPAQTINRLCGSSMSALHIAASQIMAGLGDVYLVGGVEHMGHVPMNHGIDFNPRLSKYTAKAAGMMGLTAELLARQHSIKRQAQDEMALRSHQRAQQATESGAFDKEVLACPAHDADGVPFLAKHDEVIRADASLEALSKLRPVFDPRNGTVTAGNSSAISDGASCLLVMSEERARDLGMQAMAKVKAMSTVGVSPSIMGYGPVPAVQKSLERAGLSQDDIDFWEINEAFAAQSLAVLKDLKLLDCLEEKVNVHGGAISLGHPLGCSGARIVGTLLHIMQQKSARLGVASMCIGFGQGVSTVLESV